MADDADAAVAFAQRVEEVQDLVQGLVVEAAEALVDGKFESCGCSSPDQAKQGMKSPSE
ncbi:hypothetical protein [Streptomyces sp. NPDC020362]|uniref:hypothetical protein n=1 Tax=Streptomyces sp. NPDC020362 TaxID=3154486 RepID=UPI0033DC6EE9